MGSLGHERFDIKLVIRLTELINVAVIGMGKMGILHTGILNSFGDVEVKVLVDTQDTVLDFIKAGLPSVKIYKNYTDALNYEDVDLVYITTPNSLHTKIALECVQREIPFFVEKPLGTSVDDCLPLIKSFERKQLINMIGYSKRYIDTFRKGKQLISSERLGDLIYFSSYIYVSQLFKPGKGWRYKWGSSGGGVLNTLATHLVDLLLWYFGDISSLEGNIMNYYSKNVDDFVHAYMNFDSGLSGYMDASWSVRNYRIPEIKLQVECERGMLIITDDYVKIFTDDTSNWKTYYKQDLFKGVEFDLGGPEYTREDRHMIDCVRNNTNTDIDIFEGFKVQNIIETIYKSASSKRVVEVASL